MLTPQEINDKVFVKAVFGGYDMTGVDDFLESLSADYSALYKENATLKGKLKVLVEKVEEYRSTEDSMRMALLTAQKTGDDITNDAYRQKETILKKADDEAKVILSRISSLVADEEVKLSVAAKETAKFIKLSQAIMQRHNEFLTKLETARRTITTPSDSAPPSAAPVPVKSPESAAPPTPLVAEDSTVPIQTEPSANELSLFSNDESDSNKDASEQYFHSERDVRDVFYPRYDEESETELAIEAGETTAPRPKFDFDDLKFGANFENNN